MVVVVVDASDIGFLGHFEIHLWAVEHDVGEKDHAEVAIAFVVCFNQRVAGERVVEDSCGLEFAPHPCAAESVAHDFAYAIRIITRSET